MTSEARSIERTYRLSPRLPRSKMRSADSARAKSPSRHAGGGGRHCSPRSKAKASSTFKTRQSNFLTCLRTQRTQVSGRLQAIGSETAQSASASRKARFASILGCSRGVGDNWRLWAILISAAVLICRFVPSRSRIVSIRLRSLPLAMTFGCWAARWMRRRSFAKSGSPPATKPLCTLAGADPDGNASLFRIELTCSRSTVENARKFPAAYSFAPSRVPGLARDSRDALIFCQRILADAAEFQSSTTAHRSAAEARSRRSTSLSSPAPDDNGHKTHWRYLRSAGSLPVGGHVGSRHQTGSPRYTKPSGLKLVAFEAGRK